MAPEVLAAHGLRRLADQLQTLSELTESLTYRLLELEEKVAAVDLQLEPLQRIRSADAMALSDDTELRLDDTEERLSRVESLLAGLGSAPHLPAPSPDLHNADAGLEADSHFPEEDFEQTFLDEDAQDPSLDLLDEEERLIA